MRRLLCGAVAAVLLCAPAASQYPAAVEGQALFYGGPEVSYRLERQQTYASYSFYGHTLYNSICKTPSLLQLKQIFWPVWGQHTKPYKNPSQFQFTLYTFVTPRIGPERPPSLQTGQDPNTASYGLANGACGYTALNESQWPYWNAAAIGPSNALAQGSSPMMGCGRCIQITCTAAASAWLAAPCLHTSISLQPRLEDGLSI